MSDAWFYVDSANAQCGPCTVSQLCELLKEGSIRDDSFMWKEGLPGWEQLSSIPSLHQQLKAPTTRKAPPPVPYASKPKSTILVDEGTDSSLSNFSDAVVQPTQGSGFKEEAAIALTKKENWLEKLTADGVPYYFNSVTETCDWDKPDCLKTPEELDSNSGAWIWVSDEKEGYVPARIVKGTTSDSSINVQLQSGSKRTIKKTNAEPMWPLKPSSLNHIEDDLVMVDDINIGLMVHSLKERYRKDQIYTWVGANHSVLVSINPFKQLPIYGPAQISEYSKPSAYRLDPPHTFAIANSAFRRLCVETQSQAILISGESGAGKTEATKQCFSFLAEVAGSSNAVEQRILCANPVLEAFGNAKTLRNNNSSRFGRWTEVHFDAYSRICGARIENYLLEKQRVVAQAKGERNYHIFYQLCSSPEVASSLALSSSDHFRYLLSSGCLSVPGIDDNRDFREMDEAFENLGFRMEEKLWCFEVCAAVLHLGNISFQSNGEGSEVIYDDKHALHYASHFLKVDPAALAAALTQRTIEVRGDVTKALNNKSQATAAADALAKAVYDTMFDWLVGRINLAVSGATTNTFIGVLDIFGFEIFEKNHFEQLCINYTNEKLQQHFNRHTFQEEESVYQSEAISFKHVEFIDNQPVVDLIEKKPYGLMPLLDEEVKLPKGSDTAWIGKCKQHNNTHQSLNGTASGNPNRFVVKHYAGNVTYDCGGFVDTNRDNLFRDLYNLLSSSSSPITQAVFPPKDTNPRRVTTLGEKFRRALLDLMGLVDVCEPWYIRCIKPNDKKASNTFDAKMCIEQLTYAGVFEAVAIRKNGYPFRLTHRRFANRYRCLAYKPTTGWASLGTRKDDWRRMCSVLLSCVNQDFSNVQIGATMVLYRAEEHRILELLRNLCLEMVLPVAQRAARRRIGRSFRKCMIRARAICSRALQQGAASSVTSLKAAITQADEAVAPIKHCFSWEPPEMVHCREMLFALGERETLCGMLRSLLLRDPVQAYGELRAAIGRCSKIKHLPGADSDYISLEQQARAALHHASSVKLDPIIEEALALLERRVMEEVVSEAKAAEYDSPGLADIREKLALPEVDFVSLQLEVAKATNDPARIVNRQIKLKEMYLDANEGAFALSSLSILRDPEEWAAMKPLKTLALGKKSKHELAKGFLQHSTEPIHKSLTLISGMKGEPAKQFKNMLGYSGDRKYQYPDPLLHEMMEKGLELAELRPELYVQVMKQLTANPHPASVERYWQVLMMFLHTFPPPADVENYVHSFVRANAPEEQKEKLKLAVHMSVAEGPKPCAPPGEDIRGILGAFFEREIEPRYNIEQDVVTAAAPARPQRAGWGAAAAMAARSPSTPQKSEQSLQIEARTTATSFESSPRDVSPLAAPPPPPVPPKPRPQPTAKVIYDYDPAGQPGMLTIRANQVVNIIDSSGADWWMGELNGQQGWVPAAYVSLQ